MRELLIQLRATAARCRELETTATDTEAARELAVLAEEIEIAVPILEASLRREVE